MPVLKGFKDGKAIIEYPDAKKYVPVWVPDETDTETASSEQQDGK